MSGNLNMHDGENDASYTGQVGTALYVAPELNIANTRSVHYNQAWYLYFVLIFKC